MRYQYEVWIRSTSGTARVGSILAYNNYNSAAFGTSIVANGRVTVTKNDAVFDNARYSSNPANDNTATRFAFSWFYIGGTGNGVAVPTTTDGVLAFTIQITVVGSPSTNSGITFEDALMAGEQYQDDETTAWPSVSGISLITNGALPVQLASFTGTRVSATSVRLNWRTISEINNYGFYAQRRTNGLLDWWIVENSFVAGHGTTNEPHDYSFTDNSAPHGNLQYRLKQVDLDGTIHFTEPISVSSPTSVKEIAPKEFSLKQNYPNPFNPSTTIKFSVEQTGRATLEVFNLLGQKVATLFDDVVEAGYYQTVNFSGSELSSGMYLYRLQSEKKSELKRFVLVK